MRPVTKSGGRPNGSVGHLAHAGLSIAGMTLVLMTCAWLVGGADGVFAAAVVTVTLLLFAPRLRPATVMRVLRAVPLDPWWQPQPHALVAALARAAGLPAVPRLYLTSEAAINAFAVGEPNDSAIAVSRGALRRLSLRELRGVLAHETAHIAAGDVGLIRLTDAISRVTGAIAMFGLGASLVIALSTGGGVPLWAVGLFAVAPTAASMLRLAFARGREFAADATAARLTGDPVGLASALATIEAAARWRWHRLAGPVSDVLTNPLLRTHPATRERIGRLLDRVAGALPAGAAIPIFDGRRATLVAADRL